MIEAKEKKKVAKIDDLLQELSTLTIPKDFSAVHNIRDLFSVVEAGKKISKYFVEYKEEFVKSFFMTADEVLDMIPTDKGWKVCNGYQGLFDLRTSMFTLYSDESIADYDERQSRIGHETGTLLKQLKKSKEEIAEATGKLGVKITEELKNKGDVEITITRSLKNCKTLADKLRYISPDKPVFLVNTIDKKIEVNWSRLPTKKIESKYSWNDSETILDTEGFAFSFNLGQREITGSKGSTIDEDTQTVNQKCELTTYWRKYIPRDGDWYSGRRTHEYANKSDIMQFKHLFCMRTNKYLGVKVTGNKEALSRNISMRWYG